MTRRSNAWQTLLILIMDLAMAALAYYAAFQARTRVPIPTPLRLGPFIHYVPQMVIHTLSIGLTFFFFRLYHMVRGASRIDLLYRLLSAVSIATLLATALTFLALRTDQGFTRGLILYHWGFSIVLIGIGRMLTGWVQRLARRRRPERLVIVGTGDIAQMILQKTRHARLGYQVVGFVDGEQGLTEVAGLPVLGSQAELARIVREHQIDEAVIALPSASNEDLMMLIAACESERALVRVFPDFFQLIAYQVNISDLDGLPLLTVRDVGLRGWRRSAKRAMDLIFSAVGLVFLSPLMLFLALLVRLESKGPVFYAQERVGLDGKPFPMLKFRSMRVDAESGSGPVWASAGDPRTTRVGAFLRRLSLDELPQLINVLVGDMSLVGPRPERPIFVEQFRQVVPRYMDRHSEKAGMSGWAQVNGLRGDTSIVERTKYDLYYVENWSLLFDLKIIVRTVINLFRGDRHAY